MTLKAIHEPSNCGFQGAEVHQWCTKLKIFGHLSLLWHRGSEQTQSYCLLPGRQQAVLKTSAWLLLRIAVPRNSNSSCSCQFHCLFLELSSMERKLGFSRAQLPSKYQKLSLSSFFEGTKEPTSSYWSIISIKLLTQSSQRLSSDSCMTCSTYIKLSIVYSQPGIFLHTISFSSYIAAFLNHASLQEETCL